MNIKNSIQNIPNDVIKLIPAKIATYYCIIPVEKVNGEVIVLISPNLSPEEKEDLKIILNFRPQYVITPKMIIEELINKYYGVGASLIDTLTHTVKDVVVVEDNEKLDAVRDDTISTLVNELFMDAINKRASDIHIEPFERTLRIRYRIDGLLSDASISEKALLLKQNLVSRIKIMSKLDIGEKRKPQDGRIKIRFNTDELDLRISIIPSAHGEAVVIRILRPLELLDLNQLGFSNTGIKSIQQLVNKPHGVVLVTGPTGSGKTTTLYACLKAINKIETKIITIEDPIEYKLTGIIQMQVNPKIDFTFNNALRSILRHDPDCIMVGEIRDKETAEIAIRSSLTGHLVFSTLHTNDAPSTVIRLIEMGVEPYLVASALQGVIAQRLVRKRCSHCQNIESSTSVCTYCAGSGYFGRTVVSEIMPMTEYLQDLIVNNQSSSKIREAAIEAGMICMHDDALSKSQRKITTDTEVERVI